MSLAIVIDANGTMRVILFHKDLIHTHIWPAPLKSGVFNTVNYIYDGVLFTMWFDPDGADNSRQLPNRTASFIGCANAAIYGPVVISTPSGLSTLQCEKLLNYFTAHTCAFLDQPTSQQHTHELD